MRVCAASRSERSTSPTCSPSSPARRQTKGSAISPVSAPRSCGSPPRAARTRARRDRAERHHQARQAALAGRRDRRRGELAAIAQARVRRAPRSAKALAALAKSRCGRRSIRIGRRRRGSTMADVLRALAIDTHARRRSGSRRSRRLDDVDRHRADRRLEGEEQGGPPEARAEDRRRDQVEAAEVRRSSARQPSPDEVKRKRAERAQLLREVEAVAESLRLQPKVSRGQIKKRRGRVGGARR